MKSTHRVALWCLWALLLLSHAVAAQPVVRITGTGSGVGGIQLLAKAFMQAHSTVKVEVEPALGSTAGIKALIAGRIEIAVSNRKPNDLELIQLPLLSVEYARTPLVVAVHTDLGVTGLTLSQLAGLYGEGAATFPNGRRARPVLRLSDRGETELLRAFSPEVAKAVDAASSRRGMLSATTDSDTADLIEHTPGAFGLSTLALIESEQRPLIGVVLDGKAPSVAHLLNGSYPYFKSLHLIFSDASGPNTRMFVAFARSTEGRALLAARGHAPS